MRLGKIILVIVAVVVVLPVLAASCAEDGGGGADVPTEQEEEKTAAEKFAEKNDISVELAESIESALLSTIYKYDLGDVYNFEQTNDWANGKRYKMWMDMEYIWFAYCEGDVVVGIRDSYSSSFYQAD